MKQKNSNTIHTALYRKYRPSEFKDVIGQDHVVSVLENSIASESVAHAYVFAGTRGTGKTSIARIFARAIGSHAHDIYEIDAASNRGIDDVRSIRDSVQTLPFESKYKVYIIDEAHMLTKEAWNAFLKTLEEPPSYVVFILATTELEKIPETVLSRCQVFQFKKPNQTQLQGVVQTIAKKEGYTIDIDASELIAILGDGSFRDTQGILDTVVSSTKKTHISRDSVAEITGSPQSILVHNFIDSIAEKNIEKALISIQDVVNHNINMSVWFKMVLQKLRTVLLLKYGGNQLQSHIKNNISDEEYNFLLLNSQKEGGISSHHLLKLLSAYDSVKNSFSPELIVELAVIEMLQQGAQ